jgi:dihydrolipoamide dehydrogenase
MRVVVLGGGPAGVEAAKTAAPHAAVTLVSAGPVGVSRALAVGAWLAAAADGERDVAAIAGRAEGAAAAWQERCAAELAALDVAVVAGRGRLGEPGEAFVDAVGEGPAMRIAADAVIVADGAPDEFPPGLTPDGERVFAAAQLGALATPPARVLVLGDGPNGFELCHALSLLGAAVTWLVPGEAPHSGVAPEVDGYLVRLLERQGVQVVAEAEGVRLTRRAGKVSVAVGGGTYRAEVGVVACGRQVAFAPPGLAADQLKTDIYGQTRRRGVYLIEPPPPGAASVALARARAAALHAVGRSSAPADTRHIVRSFMRRPQVAKVGRLLTDGAHGSVTVALEECAAAVAAGTTDGFLTLAWDAAGRIDGALAVAPCAAEILAPVAQAMRLNLRLEDLAAGYAPHPSLGELVPLAARKAERVIQG